MALSGRNTYNELTMLQSPKCPFLSPALTFNYWQGKRELGDPKKVPRNCYQLLNPSAAPRFNKCFSHIAVMCVCVCWGGGLGLSSGAFYH